MNDVFIVDGVRTPQGRYGGAPASMRPDDLAALVVGEVLGRSGTAADTVDEVILGATNQAGEDNRNVAHIAARTLIERIGRRIDSIGAIELDEAFAAQSLGVLGELGLDEVIVNSDGGAVAAL